MPDRNKIISVDIGGSNCKVGVINSSGEVLEYTSFLTDELRKIGPIGLADRLKPLDKNYSVDGICLGIPAMVDWEHNHVRGNCEEVPWLEESSNKKTLQDELHRPLLLVNDVEAHLVGEWVWGELKGMNTGVVLSLGTSMGSALLWNGEPQQGRRGSIMDIEKLSLNTYGDEIGTYPPGSSSHWLSGSGLKQRMRSGPGEIPLNEFFRSDQEEYTTLRDRFEDKMAHLLGTVIVMLDPERIVLGGGLTQSKEEWMPAVEDKINDFITEDFRGVSAITLAHLRNEDVTKGPAAFWDWNNQKNG